MPSTAVIQITNLSSSVDSEQMRTLFGFLGDIEELRLYPPDHTSLSFSSKVCYIKYKEPSSVGVAQHLTNTVFIDRALIVVPCAEGKIPEEAKALSLLAPATPAPSLMPGGGLLPIPSPAPLQNLGLPLPARSPLQLGLDSSLSTISSPPIMGNVDPSKIDEIRRTVYVGNLNSQTTTAEQLLEFFKQVGEVRFVRMAGDETQPTRFAFVEFSNQDCVSRALAFNGVMFGDRPLKINHSNNAIVKPPEMTPQAAAKELEDVMKRVREAQSTIAAAIDPADCKKRSPSRSRRSRKSYSRSRSHSRSRSQRKRSRSRHRRGRPSQRSWRRTSDAHKRRSRDRRYSRSHSRERQKNRDGKMRRGNDTDERRSDKKGRMPYKVNRRSSRSPINSRGHRKRSKSRSRSARKKARSPSPKRGKKDRRGEYGQDSSREWRERSTSRRRSRDSDRQESKSKKERVYKQKEQDYESDGEDMGSGASEDFSPHAHHNGRHADECEEFSTA
ncbi:splicing regulatory glutamine/lysine-rich protein 1 [Silurus meridionalis]|nr:splicing regulatory glutamine/lysine-rich protein 1 [Silurus meridionalis]